MVSEESRSFLSRNTRSFPFVEVRQSFSSTIATISPFVDQLMRFIERFRGSDATDTDIEMALREALANAVIHGNREDPTKRVYVTCRCYGDEEVFIKVEDKGNGFDASTVPDPTTPSRRLATHGRGIFLMKALMDEVSFEEGGCVVRMRKNSNSSTEMSLHRQSKAA
jgi:serine/threonine-protein kinase RsbW